MIDKYFKTRKSIRSFSDKDISDDLLKDILSAAMLAPTTGNMQLYSVVITRDIEMKKQLYPAHFNQPAACNATILMTFCADYNRFIKWCTNNSAEPGYNNFQSFMAAVLDTTIFAQQFNTIAEINGLGCCYLGTTTYNAPQIAKVLDLPKMTIPLITLAVGYPSEEAIATPQVERLPLNAVIHLEKYNDYDNSQISKLYFDKESLPANQQFVKENNKENLAQVFTDVRYTKENNEYFSKVYHDFIVEQGFKIPE